MPAPKPGKFTPGNFDLLVKRASAGLGLFANQLIPKGVCIIEYTGRPLAPGEEYTSRSKYLFTVTDTLTIDGAPRSNRARYINHSCEPNCDIEIRKGRVYIFSLRAIQPGEELAYDYGEDYFAAYIGDKCRCLGCAPKAAVVARDVAKAPEAAAGAREDALETAD